MDTAEEDEMQRALMQQGALLGRQQEEIAASRHAYTEISLEINQLTERFGWLLTSPPAAQMVAPPPDPEGACIAEPRLNPPAPYSGEPNTSLLPVPRESGERPCGITSGSSCCFSFESFSEELRKVFDRSAQGTEAARALALLRQGEQSVSSYSIEFHTLAASCGWNDKALWDHFLHGLAEHLKDEIYSLELPSSLDGLINLTIRVDSRLALRSRHRRGVVSLEPAIRTVSAASSDAPSPRHDFFEDKPMQVGRARLTAREHRRHLENQLCLYCGEPSDMVAACPVAWQHLPSKGGQKFQALLRVKGAVHQVSALIDSGAEGDFMDAGLAMHLGISSVALAEPISAKTLCSTLLFRITHATRFITLTLSGNHSEEIHFLLIHSPNAQLVLGHTWLAKHNPHIDWALNSLLAWSPFCLAQCLGAAFTPVVSCSVLQEEPVNLASIPEAYHDLRAFFSKSRASSLPPHRLYDCAIDLLPGISPPKGRLYSLSRPEREAMERYIHDSQVAGIIRPSFSPAGAGFFFVEKKNGSLAGGNHLHGGEVRVPRPSAPFLGFVLSPEGIRMDPAKVRAVADWPTPDSRRAVQRFLGFADFYGPVSSVHCGGGCVRGGGWGYFVPKTILGREDTSLRLFSHRLTPPERNYDIGNRELLAVRLALGEWRHWLEGTGVPFIVWTDHKNLEYIRTAKRLNSRQARWALFFGQFRFNISYHPGSKNGKPNTLSRIFEVEASPTLPVAILPPEQVVAAVTWGVESRVRTVLSDATIPAGCPEGLLFVHESVRTSVLQWGHSSELVCHPGATRTCMLIKQRFWWPSVVPDARRFVLACPVCAAGKDSNRPPAGLLQPLSVPSWPWSHIAMDFITGLPLSSGKTVVLTVVDRFSKAVHFIPLPKLPSVRETAAVVLHHVFRIHGLPVNVVSDRGPQFVSRFWTEFCRQLGVTASLSSGYHPQTNGQAERANQDLERVLRCVASAEPSSWSSRLTMVEYTHNSLPVSSTVYSLSSAV
ncbi:Transposon Tf2-6 polyprotein [Labeo rohita]|uniref:Gypsy retrotransposon integrase-like protein 1 n=1 Tax=Labeo rohita TaxID=84645 RepID=A0ABQ8L059_LABRO|nr:Transposon Tf2-6 polyprotein [Labeo rohita]